MKRYLLLNMNNQLIEKVIKSNCGTCPPFAYDNPLLDRNISKLLSKSLIKVLQVSRENCNINSNLKFSVLENIKKICQIEPEKHLKVDESFTELMTEIYQKNIKDSVTTVENTPEKILDAFIVKKMRSACIKPSFKSTLNPETVQALVNLNESGAQIETISKEVIHWNTSSKYKSVIKDLWTNRNAIDSLVSKTAVNDLSLKMKPEIERIVLENCYKILECNNIDIEEMFTLDSSLSHIIKTSAISSECYQICCNVLNCLFITINFNLAILTFISTFVNYVKLHCLSVSFSTLYPPQLSSIVLLLDIDLHDFPILTKTNYIALTMKHLKGIQETNESDLILLLSHFPDWFDIYFSNVTE